MERGATLSRDAKYRYNLWRVWKPGEGIVSWVMVNPSTADAQTDDFTTLKCVRFAKMWGFGGIQILNLFPYRAVDPKVLRQVGREVAVGDPFLAEAHIVAGVGFSNLTVAAWGKHGQLWGRDKEVLAELLKHTDVHALQLTIDGTPYHPMNVKGSAYPFLWKSRL